MKKFLIAASLLLATASLGFAQKPDKSHIELPISKIIAKLVLEQPNPNASTNAQTFSIVVQDTFINVKDPLTTPRVPTYRKDHLCLAWPLNENWLITAATCGQKQEPHRQDVKVKTHEIFPRNTDFDFTTNDRIMLIWKKNEQSTVSFAAPFTKLLAVDTAARLFSLQWQNKILLVTKRKVPGSKAAPTSIEPGYKGQYTCEITRKSYQPTESLFVVTPQESELLAAFSNVYHRYNHDIGLTTRPSKFFTSLTKRDLQFIKETVNEKRPQDWQSIKTRLFYNSTTLPYFK